MKRSKPRYGFILVAAALALTFCFATYKLGDWLLSARREKNAFSQLSAIVAENSATPSPRPSQPPQETAESEIEAVTHEDTPVVTEPPKQEYEAEPTSLPQYAPLYEMNADFFGWLSIEGTDVDYPVMYSPDRPEYYLNRAFDGTYSGSGVPFIDGHCPAEGNYYLIYGHHMQNKTMFGQLPKYADKDYCNEHPVIRFDTRFEQREYIVMAVFLSRIYGDEERGVFRYYEYFDLSDEAVFNEYVRQAKAAALYDTGIDAEYGDELLVLSTCNYHTAEGRFVVVANRII